MVDSLYALETRLRTCKKCGQLRRIGPFRCKGCPRKPRTEAEKQRRPAQAKAARLKDPERTKARDHILNERALPYQRAWKRRKYGRPADGMHDCVDCGTLTRIVAGSKRCSECRAQADKVRAYEDCRRRRLIRRHIIGWHSRREWIAIVAKQRGKCVGCKQRLPLTRDHVVPQVLGGTDFAYNIQGLCMPCNSRKHAKLEVKTISLFDQIIDDPVPRGSKHRPVLSPFQVIEIRSLRGQMKAPKVASKFSVTKSTIWSIWSGVTHKIVV